MNGFDPRLGVVLNIIAVLSGLVAAGTIGFAGLAPATVDVIKTTALDLFIGIGAVNSVLHLYSSSTPGPMITPPK